MSQVNGISKTLYYGSLSIKKKLIVLDLVQRFPEMNYYEIAEMLCIHYLPVERFLKEEYLTVPSKLNKKCEGKKIMRKRSPLKKTKTTT